MTAPVVRADYPKGTVETTILHGGKTVDVFCGAVRGQERCGYVNAVKIETLPRVTWAEIGRRFLCPKCGVKGDVQIRFRHNEGYTARASNIIGGEIVK
ncbi:MAG: hypothetical protein JZU55_02595 [Afipia sp.]|nr:hypothetical protein [Afipia sp.]